MPHHSASDASSAESENDDAPESISLSQSKKHIQTLESDRRNAELIQRRAKRDKNRELDRKLKERAAKNHGGKGSVDGVVGSVVRKKKRQKANVEAQSDKLAMQEAEAEASLESDGEEFMGISKGEISVDDDDTDDARGSNSSGSHDDTSDEDATPARHPDHLPDELFAAAFSSQSKRRVSELDASPTKPAKKRKLAKKDDIVVGSRAIRILPNSSAPPVPSTAPSKKINKFLDRTLALKNGKQNLRTKGWERRPVNIGVLKRAGPAVSFVRNR